MRRKTSVCLVLAGISTATLGALAPSALASTAPQPNDAVLVGSDTVQFAGDFAADGSTANPGYNSTGKLNRIFNFFATGDANGRFTAAGGSAGSPGSGSETAVLKAGQKPVQIPNGSGAGVGALINDAPSSAAGSYRGLSNGSLNLARMSRLPNSTEKTTCDTNTTGCNGLHVFEIANDTLAMAKLASSTKVVPLDAVTLWHVYNCDTGYTTWNGANIGGTDPGAIIPLLPQSGSGTRNFFLADLDVAKNAAEGGGAVDPPNLTSCVPPANTVQEHDPSVFTTLGANADRAIEPFSTGRLTLINSSAYFASSGTANGTPATGFAAGTVTATLTGSNPHSGQPAFTDVRALFVTARQKDVTSGCTIGTETVCFQTGGTKNIVNSLIAGGATSTLRNGVSAADYADAGFTAKFQDCGIDPDDSATSTNICVTTP
jgi:hypothetical protein